MFFGLLAIAFNTMAQPTGRICDAPAHINFQLRISPIECAVDTLVMIGRLLFYGISCGSFAEGAKAVITDRFFFDDEQYSYISALQGSTAARILVAFFTFFQAVKIFCCENVVLTKVWAGIYIAHWLCGEVLICLKNRINLDRGQAMHYRTYARREHGLTSLPWLVAGIASFFPLFFGALGLSGLAKASMGRNWGPIQCIGMVVLVFGCIPFTIASVYVLWARRRPLTFLRDLIVIILSPALLYLMIGVFVKHEANTLVLFNYVLTAVMAGTWVLFGYLWATKGLGTLWDDIDLENRQQCRPLEKWLSWWLVIIYLASAYVYYQYTYSTQGKIRPRWSEGLG